MGQFCLNLAVLLFVLISVGVNAEQRPNLVLLPVQVDASEESLAMEYGYQIQNSLQNRYRVFYGQAVEQELEKIYEKVASQIDCDSSLCNREIALELNAELVGYPAVKKISGGYLMSLSIRNVLSDENLYSKTLPCEGCNTFQVIDALPRLVNVRQSAPSPDPVSETASSLAGLIVESQPSEARVSINGKQVGKTPYQRLSHTLGEELLIKVELENYHTQTQRLTLDQPITPLNFKLKPQMGRVAVSTEPYTAGVKVLVDGKDFGTAPYLGNIPAGSHAFSVILPGGRRGDYEAEVTAGGDTRIPFSIESEEEIAQAKAIKDCHNLYEQFQYPKAFDPCSEAAQKGDSRSQAILGLLYREGLGTQVDLKKAQYWYRKAAPSNEPLAMALMCFGYAFGEGDIAKEPKKAYELCTQADKQGDLNARYYLANFYSDGMGVTQNKEQGSALFRAVLTEFRSRANQGDLISQGRLGWMYQNGKGVPLNDTEAARWFRKAAEQGEAYAQNNLGVMYQYGKGVSQNDTEAVRWYRKAVEQGYARAQYNLGWMFKNGNGVSQSDTEAVRWWRKAAEQGNAKAQTNLGWMYVKGKGVPQSDTEAVRWYRKAADQEDQTAINNLKNLCRDKGIGC